MELRDPNYIDKLIESRKKPNIFIRLYTWIKSKFIKEDEVPPRVLWEEPEVVESLPYNPDKPNYVNEESDISHQCDGI